MAITDNATLVAAVADWLARSDLTAAIPNFIQLAESRLNRDVKSPRMLLKKTGSIVSYLIPIPVPTLTTDARFQEITSLTVAIGGYDVTLEPVTPAKAINQTVGGTPRAFYVLGSNIVTIGGAGTELYTLLYKASLPTISSSANQNTNWLLDRAPELYLYAALLEASPYLKDDARIQTWAAGYSTALASLNKQEGNVAYAPAPRIRSSNRAP